GIVIDRCRVHLQRHDIFSPVLRAHIGYFGSGTGNQVVHATSKARQTSIYRAEMLDHGHLGELVSYQKQMRKHRSVLTIKPMENFDWQLDLDAAWHVKKCS